MKGKKKKKRRIRRLGLAEMCNVKHHRCQLGNLGQASLQPQKPPSGAGRRAPMWIENGVVSGPSGRGWGLAGLGDRPQSPATRLGWSSPARARACLGGRRVREGAEARRWEGCRSDSLRVPGDLHAKLMGFNELSGRWAFAFYLVLSARRGKRVAAGC